jgi:hypothetical protein
MGFTVVLSATSLCALPARAQFDSAQISGVISDSSGAVIPGVSVAAVNEGTLERRETVTNEQGIYVLPSLPVATYTVTAELPGFRKFVKKGNELSAAVNVRLNVTMELGDITESVEVQATTNEVLAETAVIGRNVGVHEIAEIPLAGRNVNLVAQFSPGVQGQPISTNRNQGFGDLSAGSYRINGARSDEYMVTVDGGISVRIRQLTGYSMGAQNVDTVQEVQVLTSNYNAEYGRASGGIIKVVSKSGTREFHGVAFETVQNTMLNANTWTRNASGDPAQAKTPPTHYNNFGFALGGPIYIPGKFNADRTKLFFYIGYEWGRNRDLSPQQGTVPSAAMRNGDFSELLDPNNIYFRRVRVVTDPITRQPFANNVIPANRISPNGRALLNEFPLPTPGFLQGTNNWKKDMYEWDNQRKGSIKIDYALNQRHRLALRSTYIPHYWNTFYGLDSYTAIYKYPNRTATLTFTSTLSPTFLNEFTLSHAGSLGGDRIPERYCSQIAGNACVTKVAPTYPTRASVGLTYPLLFPGVKTDFTPDRRDKIADLDVQGFSSITTSQFPGESGDFSFTLTNNMTKLTGSHTFKWGINGERSGMKDSIQFSSVAPPNTRNTGGQFFFQDTGHPNTTGLALANVLLGSFNNYSEFDQKPRTNYVTTMWDWFFQDSWKARRDLTIEMGLRYSLWPEYKGSWGTISEFQSDYYDRATAPVIDPRGGFIVSGDRLNGIVLPGCGPTKEAIERFPFLASGAYDRLYHCLSDSFVETPKNGFQPRVGLAYSLNPRTAIRSGVGMFFNRSQINSSYVLGGDPPFLQRAVVSNGNADNPGGAARRDFPLVISMADPKLKLPTAWTWNTTVERELPFLSKISLAYVGRRGYFQQRSRNINQLLPGTTQANPGVSPDALRPYPGYGVIAMLENSASSRYNGMQVQFSRRAARGIGFNVAYTLSRTMEDASSTTSILPNAYDASGQYRLSGNDKTHVLIFSSYYTLPALMSAPAPVRWVLGGWGMSGTAQIESGTPITVTTTEDIAGVGSGSGAQFWNLTGDPKVERTEFTNSMVWFNKAAFTKPSPGTFGVQANSVRQPGFWDANLSISKSFAVTEKQRFEFRAEGFNFLNHPRLANATTNPNSGSFGLITSKSGNRLMQLNLKYFF